MVKGERRGSPLLRWRSVKQESFSHGFSKSDLQALSAICEAIMPPIPLLSLDLEMKLMVLRNDALLSFFKSSSWSHIQPDEVAEIMVKKAMPITVTIVRLVLRILTFRLGTLLLCGFDCFDKKNSPCLLKFSDISLKKREKILQKWNIQWYNPLARIAFMMIKAIFLFYYFTWTNENAENPVWDAIGYGVEGEIEDMEHKEKPLDKGIIEIAKEDERTFKQRMINKGLKVTEDRDSDTYMIECDAVVVGSGCGGGVAAANLAKSGLRVVVLEKGKYFVPRDYTGLEGPSIFELFEANSLLMTHDGRFRFMAGSTVGGGSVINWGASLKTPDAIIKEWSVNQGSSIYSNEDYKAAMDRVYERLGVTEKLPREGFQNQILRKGCEKLGLDVKTVPRNSSEKHDCGSCSFGCRTGGKRGTDSTWLVDAVNNNAVILTQCKAEKLILDDTENAKSGRRKRCLGVTASVSNRTKKIQINAKVTIVACGSLMTPGLLASSGLKNPNIGRGLHIHPILMAWGYFPEKKSDFKGAVHEGEIVTSMHYVPKMDSATPHITMEIPAIGPGTFAALIPWVSGSDIKERLAKYTRTSHIFVMVRDKGVGEVKGGIIKYKLTKEDEENLTIGLKQALRILVAAGAEEVGTYRSDGQRIKCKGIKEKDLEAFLHTVEAPPGVVSMSKHWTHSITAHQMGCCRMGATEKEGAIDGYGESWEAQDLYVSDASVLPTALGVNPMITIQSTAYCISKRLAEIMKMKKKKKD